MLLWDAFGLAKSAGFEGVEIALNKVEIGLENVWNKFLTSPLEMRDFTDKVGSVYVGSNSDVGNVFFNGYPEHWIKILGSRIKKVQFKDYRCQAGAYTAFKICFRATLIISPRATH